MQIVQTDEIPLKRGLEHRGGIFHGRIMVEGEPGALDNFQLSFGQMGGDFNSPRHRHNFEQIRYQLEGVLDYGRDGKLVAGMVGYFPEAVYYGPQTQDPNIPCKTIVLQFGGASGSGYISEERFQQGVEELKAFGSFEKGVFHRPKEDGGRKNQDAYEAVWEHIHGRKLEYPKSEHTEPVFMDPAAFEWQDEPGLPGVRRKVMGVFSARKLRIRLLGLNAGASAPLAPNSIAFVMSGRGTAAGQEWRQHATLRTSDEADTLVASERSEVLELHIPHLMTA